MAWQILAALEDEMLTHENQILRDMQAGQVFTILSGDNIIETGRSVSFQKVRNKRPASLVLAKPSNARGLPTQLIRSKSRSRDLAASKQSP